LIEIDRNQTLIVKMIKIITFTINFH